MSRIINFFTNINRFVNTITVRHLTYDEMRTFSWYAADSTALHQLDRPTVSVHADTKVTNAEMTDEASSTLSHIWYLSISKDISYTYAE